MTSKSLTGLELGERVYLLVEKEDLEIMCSYLKPHFLNYQEWYYGKFKILTSFSCN